MAPTAAARPGTGRHCHTPTRPGSSERHAGTVALMHPWYISVDVEAAGPFPAGFSMLAIGACCVDRPDMSFYAELKPERPDMEPSALAVAGLSMEHLAAEGEDPAGAVERFAEWVESVTPQGSRPVFVGFNAPFDWMFLADALHRHAGRNPFGHSAVDIKALEMGVAGVGWEETSFAAVAERYGVDPSLPHHALEDARQQAEVFRRILARLDRGGT